jgi:hypothetical protein
VVMQYHKYCIYSAKEVRFGREINTFTFIPEIHWLRVLIESFLI